MRKIIFFPLIESDLLILASISKLIKYYDSELCTILLISKHPRTVNILKKYKELFNIIIELPYMTFTYNLLKYNKYFSTINKTLDKLEIKKEDIVFFFDIYDLVDLYLYYYFKKRGVKITTISAFECNEFEKDRKDRISIVWSGTIQQSLISMLLIKKLFFEYRQRKTKYRWLRYIKVDVDFQICIMKSKYRNNFKKIFKNILYPVLILNSNDINNQKLILKNNSIIILINTQLETHLDNYKKLINELINDIKYLFPLFNIYIKDHPNLINYNYKWIEAENINFIHPKISIEEIYISNYNKIKLVISYGSTALITASWFGIKTVNITEYLGFSESIVNHLNDFMNFGENIININRLEQLKNIQIEGENNKLEKTVVLKQWVEIFKEMKL